MSEETGVFSLADLDTDGDLDVASSSGDWYENTGCGSFSSRAIGADSTSLSIDDVVDVDRDGAPNVLDTLPDRAVSYKNDGTGAFSGPRPITDHGKSWGLSAADGDGDEDLDVFAVRSGAYKDLVPWRVNTEDGFRAGSRVTPRGLPINLTVTVRADSAILRWASPGAEEVSGYTVY